MEDLAPSTVKIRLAAVRKMVAEAQRNGILSAEEASNLTDVPNVRQRGTRLGNWLTKEQARELLQVPDRSLLKGKRDYGILALLVGCALRGGNWPRSPLDNRWVIADLSGKGGWIRTVAVLVWVKQGINAWQPAAGIEEGPLCSRSTRSARWVTA